MAFSKARGTPPATRGTASQPTRPAAGRTAPPPAPAPSPAPRPTGPTGSTPVLLSTADALELQRTAGNRATDDLLRQQRRTRGPAAVPVQRDDLSQGGSGYKTGGGEQLEYKIALSDPKKRIKISGKFTFSRKGSKYLESPTATPDVPVVGASEAKWSLGENKATIERASGKHTAKLASALARADLSSNIVPGFPGLRARVSTKGLEAKFDAAKKEADLDLIKIAVAVDGDVIEILAAAGLAHLGDRVVAKASIEAEVGLSVADLVRLKAAWRHKEAVKQAADEALKHGDDLARHADELKKLDTEHKKLAKDLPKKQRSLEAAKERLARAEAKAAKSAKPSRRVKTELANAKKAVARAETGLKAVEEGISRNRAAVKTSAGKAREAKKGLAASAEKLQKYGRKLDDALKGVKGKIGDFGKRALEKSTKAIMKKLGKSLLMKGLAKLVPGLNIISTIVDVVEIGGALIRFFSGDSKIGVPGIDAGEGDGGGDGGDGKGTSGGDAGDGGTGDADTGGGDADADDADAGGGDAGAGKVALTATGQALADAFAGTGVKLDDEMAQTINEGLPTDLTPDELKQLLERLRQNATSGGITDPYEFLAAVAEHLADIRAGGTKVTVEGGGEPGERDISQDVTSDGEEPKAEPPQSLLPGTRHDVMAVLAYDPDANQMIVDPERQAVIDTQVFTHPDGLQVRITAINPTTSEMGPDNLKVKVAIEMEVVALPAGAAADYPYTVGQTGTENMTFLYAPKRKLWGEMDYSVHHQLKGVVARQGSGWVLARPDAEIAFEHAKLKVTQLLHADSVDTADGKVHRFVLEVVPTAIFAKEAGYMNPNGWITFKLGQAANIGFTLSEKTAAPVGAGAP